MNAETKKKKHGCLIAVGVIIVLGVIGAALGEPNSNESPSSSQSISSSSNVDSAPSVSSDSNSESIPESESDSETTSQKNAIRKAEQYLSVMPFSAEGLIKQLEFEKFSTEDATYAVNSLDVDWNEQAAKKAKQYLDSMGFSRDGLIQQLEFDGFTTEQAEYGVTQNGL